MDRGGFSKWGRCLKIMTAVLLMILAAACGQSPPPEPPPIPQAAALHQSYAPSPMAQGQLQEAWNYLYQGSFPKARDVFTNLFKNATEDKDKAAAMLGLARLDILQGDAEGARRWLELLVQASPEGPAAVEGAYLAAKLAHKRGDTYAVKDALQAMAANPVLDLGQSQQEQVVRYLLDEMGRGRLAEGVVKTIRHQAHQPLSPAYMELPVVLARVAADVDPQRLSRLLTVEQDPKLRIPMMIGMGWGYLDKGDADQASQVLAQLKGLRLSPHWAKEVDTLNREMSQVGQADPRAVGVILPLSGPMGPVGKGALEAIKLGLGLAGTTANPPSLYVEDSRSDAMIAAQAVNRLARDKQVVAIVGLLENETARAAARRAQNVGVPIILLSNDPRALATGGYVFMNSFTPKEQVDATLSYMTYSKTSPKKSKGVAMGTLIQQFDDLDFGKPTMLAVMVPKNPYGRVFGDLIRQWAQDNRSQIVRNEVYDPSTTDFGPLAKGLMQLPQRDFRPNALNAPRPVIDFHALYIPDEAKRVALLAPQLRHWGLRGVQLLGTNLWNDPWLVETAGRYLEGAIFPDAFDPKSSRITVTNFVEAFQSATGRSPNTRDALAYDSAFLLATLMGGENPPKSRLDVRRGLTGLTRVDGVCGPLFVGPDRWIRKPMHIFTIKGGQILTLHTGAIKKKKKKRRR